MSFTTTTALTVWAGRAADLLETALSQVRDGIDDAIPLVSAALTALRIDVGELPASEMDGHPLIDCVCPSDLLERGGFRGGCPIHSGHQ